jgi:hypothetical protein
VDFDPADYPVGGRRSLLSSSAGRRAIFFINLLLGAAGW